MGGDYILLFLVLFPFIIGIIGACIGMINEKLRNYFASIAVIIHFISVVGLFGKVNQSANIWFSWDAFVSGGLYLQLDGFRYIHSVITSLIFMITTLFSIEYFKQIGLKHFNRYMFFSMLTFGATMGVFLSKNLFTTFVFFEVMSLTSYVMVIHTQEKSSIKAAKTYLAVGVIGGLSMLMGLVMLSHLAGTLDMEFIQEVITSSNNSVSVFVAGLLMLVGFGAKAGMFPLHIWLPPSYTGAPFPATTVLSGVLSKAGVFGIIVLSSSIFLHSGKWGFTILILGAMTMLTGALLAVFSVDLKRTLACSSMSQIGFILVGIGMQGILGEHNALAVRGTMLHIVNHSLLKLILFLIAACIFMKTKSTRLNDIKGYGRDKPILKYSFLVAALGITGIPFFNGYISKTLIHESIVEHLHTFTEYSLNKGIYQMVEILFMVTGGLTIAYMTKVFIAIFVEKSPEAEKKIAISKEQCYISMRSGILLCGLSCVVPAMGIFPVQIMDKIALLGQEFMRGHEPAHAVHYFARVNLKGALLSIIIGAIVYLVVIRGFLIRSDKDNNKIYLDKLPTYINLEERIYRPLICSILPFIGAFMARLAHSICAIPLELASRKNEKRNLIIPPINKCFGSYIKEEKEYANIASAIPTSLKYSLLTFGLGLIVALIYILYFL